MCDYCVLCFVHFFLLFLCIHTTFFYIHCRFPFKRRKEAFHDLIVDNILILWMIFIIVSSSILFVPYTFLFIPFILKFEWHLPRLLNFLFLFIHSCLSFVCLNGRESINGKSNFQIQNVMWLKDSGRCLTVVWMDGCIYVCVYESALLTTHSFIMRFLNIKFGQWL